ncbi:type II secretion system secretin GspD [Pseudomonas sp. R-28-1W-6]|uniref:type II secretion system secretin GspD n=1 Tax=Pseudomonas sp. R-28-1W-6 TaxID=2650101 RepID=UPI001365E511|nr:type II secretion system secretin GspD [Pseudomonas sp. R-28-1W-6]MWV10728.1 type II secretion system secretin GspD [Pseudomonas sp. R-28-1W-6]
MKMLRILARPAQLGGYLLLAACAAIPGGDRATFDNPWGRKTEQAEPAPPSSVRQPRPEGAPLHREATPVPATPLPAPRAEIYRGSGSMVALGSVPQQPVAKEGEITLNFQQMEIAEVVKIILGEILGLNYMLDPNVSGTVSLQTSRPLTREALLPTLEALLQVNGAVLVKSQNFYEVVPIDAASSGALVPRLSPAELRGYQLLVIPLLYISAAELQKILEPLKPVKGLMRVDETRNLLLVAGTQDELNNIRETVRVFDVDQLRGMSVGLFRLQAVEAQVVLKELEAIFGDSAGGPLAGMVRFLPIERLNGLLVITPQAKYLDDARAWVERLDRAEGGQGVSMHVYHVQHGKAETIADILTQLFEGRSTTEDEPQDGGQINPVDEPPPPAADGESEVEVGREPVLIGPDGQGASLDVGEVSIIADDETNTLLVMATPSDYERVLQAIERLDVLSLQVLVEATIVEVALEDELRYGLQWFFKSEIDGKNVRGTLGRFPLTTPADLTPTGSLTVFDAAGARLLLDLLARDSKINVISSPTLMVLDNRAATIRVGDRVPIRTSETTDTGGAVTDPDTGVSALVTSTIQYQDTGVLLEVKPRINAGGMISMEITQEVNDVKPTTTSGIDSPTITQRRINTNVAVQSGETLVLGGLIQENNSRTSEGLPYLRNIPFLGWAFGSQGKQIQRTELVVLITPTAVTNTDEAEDVTQEYRNKLKGVTLPQDAWQGQGRQFE